MKKTVKKSRYKNTHANLVVDGVPFQIIIKQRRKRSKQA